MEAADGNRLLVEAIDSPGYDDDVAAEQRAKEVLAYIENSFDEVFDEEKKISRNPKFEEHRIHALLYFIEPTGLGLKRNDAEFMQIIGSRINIIPIIAKADGLSRDEMANFKSKVWADLLSNQIKVFDFQKSDEANAESLQLLHSVIGSTFPLENGKIGRPYPWGFVDALSEDHCDFWLLRENLLEYNIVFL
jgi:cell division control protein 11